MPTKKLSALVIPSLPAGEYWDAAFPGLILRVGARRRTWQFRYRAGGANRRARLGYYPVLGLADARSKAGDLVKRLDAGAPPSAPPPVHPRSPGALTLGALIDRYETLRAREGARTKTLPAAMRTLRHGLDSYLGLPAAEFSKADLRAARDAIAAPGRADAGEPVARLSRPGTQMGRAGGPDCAQFRPRHSQEPGAQARPRPDRQGDRRDLEGLRGARRRRLGARVRPAGAIPPGDRATPR